MENSLNTPTQDELFEMSNLSPERTGLPFVVWIAIVNGVRDDVKMRVTKTLKVIGSEFITVGLLPYVHVIQGTMAESDLNLLKQWIGLNLDVIVKHWTGEIDSSLDAISAIKPLL
jgi:hypothetical protein